MDIKVGDKVVYSRTFLRNIADYSYDSANRIGTVTALLKEQPKGYYAMVNFIKVRWQDTPEEEHIVAIGNVWPADKKHLEPS